ncbi:MAG: N-methyl-L-tryptophan oxidase [Candidatus Dormiibacterota bacterium]
MDADVAIVGTGTMGSMAAWQLARRGVSVLAFEQFAPGHDRGAAGGETRIFRTAYLEGAQYVPILQAAAREWRELEKETGRQLLAMNGGLMIASEASDLIRTVLQCVETFGLDHEVLSTAQAAQRWPQHRYRSEDVVVLDRQAGYLRPELAVASAAGAAEARGARVLRHHRVEAIEPDSDGVTIVAGGERFRAGRVVVTAGAWTGSVLPRLAASVEARRLVMTWFLARDISLFAPDRFPIFIREVDGVHFSGMPCVDGTEVKVALNDVYGAVADSDALQRSTTPAEMAPIAETVARWFPDLEPEPSRINVYQDGYTPDHHAMLGPLPGLPNVVVACGFSGHGFKMSPALGGVIADLALGHQPGLPIEHLAPARLLA